MLRAIIKFLGESNFQDFIDNRIFLGITAAVIIISIFRRSSVFVVSYLCLIALGMLIGNYIPMDDSGSINIGILIFGVGVMAVLGVIVYYLLVKTD